MKNKDVNEFLNYPIRIYEQNKLLDKEFAMNFIISFLIRNKGNAKVFEYTLKKNGFKPYFLKYFENNIQDCFELNLIKVNKKNKFYLKLEITLSGVIYYKEHIERIEIRNYNNFINYSYIFISYLKRFYFFINNTVKNYLVKFFKNSWGYLVIVVLLPIISYYLKNNQTRIFIEKKQENTVGVPLNNQNQYLEKKNKEVLDSVVLLKNKVLFKSDSLKTN